MTEEEKIEQARKEGCKKGYKDGYAKGLEEGRKAGIVTYKKKSRDDAN